MRHSYYYLVASLPVLDFGSQPAVAYENFLENCQRLLTPTDFFTIEKTSLESDIEFKGIHPFLKTWVRFNRNLKNEIARWRAIRAGKDPATYTHGSNAQETFVTEIVSQAAKAKDPLAVQETLDRFKWQYLDELVRGQYFNLEFLLVYALRLQILERYRRLGTSSKGKEIFEGYKKSVSPDTLMNF